MNFDDEDEDVPRPRRRRKPKPRGMSTGGIVLLVTALGLAIAFVIGAGAWVAWRVGQVKRATEEELQAERDAEKLEAAAAFANPVPPTAAETAEFRRFFDSLGAILDRGDGNAANANFDIDRMADELARNGALDNIPIRDRGAFRRGMKQGAGGRTLGDSLVANELIRWNRTDIRRVRWTEDRKEAVVIAVHHEKIGDDDTRLKIRWWLIKRADGWKIYDFEDLDMGMRATLLMKSMFAAQPLQEFVKGAEAMREAAQAIQKAMIAIVKEKDPDAAEAALAPIRHRNLPPFLIAHHEMVKGLIEHQRGNAEQAMERYTTSETHQPGAPLLKLLKSMALNQLQRYGPALELARAYMAELGPDALAQAQAGVALEGLGRAAEALEAYRSGLDDDTDDILCLHGLLRTLPADKKSEIADRLAKSSRPMDYFEQLLKEARVDDDDLGVAALMVWLRKAKPDDIRCRTEELKLLVKAKKHPEATGLVKKLLGEAKADERTEILNVYLFAMIGAEKFVEAYEAVPPRDRTSAFRTLAGDLEDSLDESDPEKPPPAVKWLGELIAAHRKNDAADPWLNLFDGAILQAKGEHAKAEAVLAEGVKKLADRPADPDEPGGVVNRFRARRVQCFIDMKEPLRAYAAVGPSVETFRQLANHFEFAHDPESLVKLLAAHRKEYPRALELEFWRAEAHFLNAKYDLAALEFAAFRQNATDKEKSEFPELYRAEERCIRSWVRANKLLEARAALFSFGEKNVSTTVKALVEAMSGEVGPLERTLAEASKNGGSMWMFYADEDFVRLFAADAFATLRMKYPDPRPKPPLQKAG